jgi:AcrR family transcriptional regulator
MADTQGEEQSGSGSGRSLRAQGHRTRELIIHQAKALLLEEGSLDFTLRTVARRAQISISNLQYYFPTRTSLMRAIMETVVMRYTAEFVQFPNDAPTARLTIHRLVDRALSDVRSAEVGAIWLHLASLAVTDPMSARLLDEFYANVARDVSRLLRTIKPALKGKQSKMLALLMMAFVDGLVFQMGAGHRPKTSITDRYVHDVVDLLIG